MTQYLFNVMEKDFLPDIHLLTGLIDVHENPVVKMIEVKKYPMGFGKQEEWNEVTSRNSG